MTKEELQQVINQLTESNLEEEAFFGVLEYGGTEEHYIKANRQGLELFAAELLKASRDAEQIINISDNNVHLIEWDDDVWLEDSEVFINYIEPSFMKRDQAENSNKEGEETWKDSIFKYGCLMLVALALISMIVGLITIARWIYY